MCSWHTKVKVLLNKLVFFTPWFAIYSSHFLSLERADWNVPNYWYQDSCCLLAIRYWQIQFWWLCTDQSKLDSVVTIRQDKKGLSVQHQIANISLPTYSNIVCWMFWQVHIFHYNALSNNYKQNLLILVFLMSSLWGPLFKILHVSNTVQV